LVETYEIQFLEWTDYSTVLFKRMQSCSWIGQIIVLFYSNVWYPVLGLVRL